MTHRLRVFRINSTLLDRLTTHVMPMHSFFSIKELSLEFHSSFLITISSFFHGDFNHIPLNRIMLHVLMSNFSTHIPFTRDSILLYASSRFISHTLNSLHQFTTSSFRLMFDLYIPTIQHTISLVLLYSPCISILLFIQYILSQVMCTTLFKLATHNPSHVLHVILFSLDHSRTRLFICLNSNLI